MNFRNLVKWLVERVAEGSTVMCLRHVQRGLRGKSSGRSGDEGERCQGWGEIEEPVHTKAST